MEHKGHRALMTIVNVNRESQRPNVELYIPQWVGEGNLVLPLDRVPTKIRDSLRPEQHYMVKVNIGCENADDVFVRDWEGPLPPVSDEEVFGKEYSQRADCILKRSPPNMLPPY